jgi:hypothetical protein
MKKIQILVMLTIFTLVIILVSGCSEAQIASSNVSRGADQFEIFRRVVFYNGITGDYILVIEGYCSIEKEEDGMFHVIVKTDDGKYLKHYLGISDNVTFFAEQLQPSKSRTDHYRIIFKPSVIVPDIDLR